jgi:predicted metal-dependent hydrolase
MSTGSTSWLQNVSQNIFSALSTLQTNVYATTQVKSTIDGKIYTVRDLPDKQEAADLLARVRQRLEALYRYLIATYPDKPQVKQLMKNFKPEPSRIFEATPDAEHTSYSVNKGEAVHLCLRQRQGQNESLMNENVMTFVALHEMAHMITSTIGHGPDFWNNFGWLLKQAEERKLYTYTNFAAQPVAYCGVKITDAPIYDPNRDGSDHTLGSMSSK